MTGIFSRWQPRYAECGIATFPVTAEKTPATKGYLQTGIRGSAQLAQKFQHADAFGFACGRQSKVTLADIDTADEKVLADALSVYGDSPIISRTASGGIHAWYRHNGEGRRIKRPGDLPIDILGGGYAVAPPSQITKGAYQFIRGGLDELDRLKPMVRIETPTQGPPLKASASALRGMREHDGRNAALFMALGPIARKIHQACGSRDEVLESARKHNAECAQPMEGKEVNRIVDSVWGMTLEGRNIIGIPTAFCLTHEHLSIEDSDAFKLLAFLRAHQGPHAHFMCTNGLASREEFDWDPRRIARARRILIELGYLAPVKQAGRGHAALFRWGIY